MRIDKFLWCVRISKTRTSAAELCKAGKVFVNETPAKPSREIKPGDTIQIHLTGYLKTIKVIAIPQQRISAKILKDYILDCTPQEEYEKLRLVREQLRFIPQRPKGLGRPTKKERRSLDKFLGID